MGSEQNRFPQQERVKPLSLHFSSLFILLLVFGSVGGWGFDLASDLGCREHNSKQPFSVLVFTFPISFGFSTQKAKHVLVQIWGGSHLINF